MSGFELDELRETMEAEGFRHELIGLAKATGSISVMSVYRSEEGQFALASANGGPAPANPTPIDTYHAELLGQHQGVVPRSDKIAGPPKVSEEVSTPAVLLSIHSHAASTNGRLQLERAVIPYAVDVRDYGERLRRHPGLIEGIAVANPEMKIASLVLYRAGQTTDPEKLLSIPDLQNHNQVLSYMLVSGLRKAVVQFNPTSGRYLKTTTKNIESLFAS